MMCQYLAMSAEPDPVIPAEGPSERVAAAVRTRIIRGEYRCGQRLTEQDLAGEYGVSRTSVREGIRILASQGFLSVQPYFGTFVAEMAPEEASNLIEVQGALEPLAARLAARYRRDEDIKALKAAVAAGRVAAKEGRSDDSRSLHGQFHLLLATASRNATLTELISALRDKLQWAYSTNVVRPASDAWGEHSEMVKAIERGDEVEAERAARFHIDRAARSGVFPVRTSTHPPGPIS